MLELPDCYHGDTYGPILVGVSISAGSLVNCPEIVVTVRRKATKDSSILLQITKTDGRVSTPSSTEVQFSFTKEETEDLPVGNLVLDIECSMPDDTRRSVRNLQQTFRVLADVT